MIIDGSTVPVLPREIAATTAPESACVDPWWTAWAATYADHDRAVQNGAVAEGLKSSRSSRVVENHS